MPDERSYRVALVADRYVNPEPGQFDGLAVLADAGWGVMQLPDDAYPARADVTGLSSWLGSWQEEARKPAGRYWVQLVLPATGAAHRS